MGSQVVVPRSWRSGRVGLWGRFGADPFRSAVDTEVTLEALRSRLPAASFFLNDPTVSARSVDGRAYVDVVAPEGTPASTTAPSSLDALVVMGDVSDLGLAELVRAGGPAPPRGNRPPNAGRDAGIDARRPIPVAWSAITVERPPGRALPEAIERAATAGTYVAVTDEASRRALLEGVPHEIDVIPPLNALLPRVVDPTVLSQRLEYLRAMGWFPCEHTVLVQGDAETLPLLAGLAQPLRAWLVTRPGWRIAALALPPDSHAFRRALADVLPEVEHVLPAESTMPDVVAAIAGASVCLAAKPQVVVSAAALGRPSVMLDPGGERRPDEVTELLATVRLGGDSPGALDHSIEDALGRTADGRILDALATRLDEHFDRLSAFIATAWESAPPRDDGIQARLQRLQRAYDVVLEQLHQERDVFQRRLRLHEAREDQYRQRVMAAEAEAAAARAALEDPTPAGARSLVARRRRRRGADPTAGQS